MIVIIGAGPAGLYTAIQLSKAGIKDLLVIDPRAGIYTRPGHLNLNVFVKSDEFKFSQPIDSGDFDHIKTFERGLYDQALELGIKFQRKKFLRMHEDAKAPGIVVDDGSDTGAIVPADYVFDCSGQKRVVIDAVNKIVPSTPFKLVQFAHLPVKNNFLAYVKMSSDNWEKYYTATRDKTHANNLPPLPYARSIIKLRALGWKEFEFPNSYGANFGKKDDEVKVCMYFHAPDNLAPENYEHWVQTAMECYVPNITYTQLPPSKKYTNKPRFLSFTMDAQVLNKSSYQGPNLPTVIALGDTQIDFDYRQAHGINDGLDRINSLMKQIRIKEGKITNFNPDVYTSMIESQLYTHKYNVTLEAGRLEEKLFDALERSKSKLSQALKENILPEERELIAVMLQEIDVRQSYTRAKQGFYKFHNPANILNPYLTTQIIPSFKVIQNDLLKAYAELPANFAREKQDAQKLLTDLALSWKQIGNDLFKRSEYSSAIVAYKQAAEIYKSPGFAGNFASNELAIYSNLANSYNKTDRYPEAIAAATSGLSICDQVTDEPKLSSFKEKFVYNLVKALCAQAQSFLTLKNVNEAQALYAQVQNIDLNLVLTLESKTALETMIKELTLKLPKDSSATKPATSEKGRSNAETLGKIGLYVSSRDSADSLGQQFDAKADQTLTS